MPVNFFSLFSESTGSSFASKMSRKGLMEQDLSKLDVTKLHPLSPEVISRQATINIGKCYACFILYLKNSKCRVCFLLYFHKISY